MFACLQTIDERRRRNVLEQQRKDVFQDKTNQIVIDYVYNDAVGSLFFFFFFFVVVVVLLINTFMVYKNK